MDTSEVETISAQLDQEAQLREKIKDQANELEKRARFMTATLNRIHSTPRSLVPTIVSSLDPSFQGCRDVVDAIATLIPPNQFWKWKDTWSKPLQACVFAAALCEYLHSKTLISLQRVCDIFGIQEDWDGRFQLPVEDYLHAIIALVNELSRLCVNAVTLGDFDEPFNISVFIKDVFAGFSMLNLKNDILRRRFDTVKYDVKKVEEVVYDVSLRQLAPNQKKDGD